MTALKTVSLRIRGAEADLESMGEETDKYTQATATMREEIMALSGVDIMIDDTTFKDISDILREISQEYEKLTDVNQAALMETLFGKQHANTGGSLLQNFEEIDRAIDISRKSLGSADREYANWQQSIDAALGKASATWQDFSRNFMNPSVIKGGIDAGTGILEMFIKLQESGAALPAIFAGISTALQFKTSFGDIVKPITLVGTEADGSAAKLRIFGKTFGEIKNDVGQANGALEKLTAAFKQPQTEMEKLSKIEFIPDVDAAQWFDNYALELKKGESAALDFVKAHDTPEIIQSYFNTVDGGAKTFEGYRQHAQQAQQAVQTSEVTTKSATLATYGLQVAQLALNAAISLGIGLAIQFAVQGIAKIINAENDAIEAGQAMAESWTDASETFKNTQSTINGLKDRYEALSKGVSSSGENISLTTEEFQEYSDIVAKIADIFPKMVDGYDSQGNAILDCKGNVEELTKALKEQEAALNETINSGSKTVEKGFKANYDKYTREYDKYSKIINAVNDEDAKADYLKELNMKTVDGGKKFTSESLYSVLKDLDIEVSWFDSSEELLEKAAKNLNVIKSAASESKDSIESMNAAMYETAKASLSVNKNFNELDENVQSSILSIVSNFDASFLDKITDGEGSIATWIEENIIGNLEDIDFSNALSGISELNSDMLGSEYKDAVADIIEQFRKLDDFKDLSDEEILFKVGIENPQELDNFFDGLEKKDFSGIQQGFQDALTIDEQKTFKNLHDSLSNALNFEELGADMNNMIADLFTGDNVEIKIENFEAFTKLAAQAGLSEEAVTALTYQLNNIGWENAGDTLANLEKFSIAVKSAGIESEEASKLFDSFAKSNVGGGISDLENQFNIGLISLEDFNDGVANLVQTWGQVEGLDEGKIEAMTDSFSKSVPDIEAMNEALDTGEQLLSRYYNSFGADQEFMAANLEAHIENLEKLREKAQEAGDADSFNRYTEQINAMTYALDSAKTSLGKFQQVMSQEDYDTDFNDYKEVFKALEEGYENGTTNSKKFVAAYKAMFGDIEVDIDFLGENLKSLGKLFGENVDLSDITEQLRKIKDYAVSDGDGGLKIEVPDLTEFAKDLNVGEEAALAVLQYLQMAGDIDFSNTKISTPEGLRAILDVVALNGQTYNMEFYVGSEGLDETLQEVNTLLAVEGKKAEIEVVANEQGVEETRLKVVELEQHDGKTVTTTYNVETQGQEQFENVSGEVQGMDGKSVTTKVETDADLSSANDLKDLITSCIDTTEKLRDKLSSLSSVSVGDAGMDKLKDACQKVIDKLGEIIRMRIPDKSFNVNANLSGIPGLASGGRAKGGITLVGEEGIELVRSGDKAYIVGQNGAEITTLKPGDQVYPYDETKRILKGRSGNHHEIPAYASGTIRDPVLSSGSSSSSSKSSSKSSSSDSDAKKKLEKYLEAYKEAVKELEYYRGMDIYSEKEYYRQLTALANEYLRGKKDFLDEYRSYEVEFYKFRKDMLEEDRKETLKALDDQYKEEVEITKNLYKSKTESQKEGHENAKKIEKAKYEDEKEIIKKAYEEEKKIVKRAHEDLKKEVKRAYEDEKEIVVKAYEAQKKAAKDAYEAQKKAAQDSYKAKKKAAEDAYKAEKKAAQDAYKAQKKAAKDAYDAQKKAAEDAHNAEKKALENQEKAIKDALSAYKELIDARKEALQREGTTHDYNDEVEEANREISQIRAKIDALSLDNSAKAKAERLKLEEDLRNKLSALEEKQYDRSVDLQIQALDDEYEREEKIAQQKMDLIDAQIDAISDKYDEVKEILEAAYDALVENMEASQDALMANMEAAHDAQMEGLEAAHNAHMESLELAYEAEVEALEAGHEALIKSMERDHEDYVDQLDRDHEDLLNQMEEDHEATLDQLEEDYEALLESMERANKIILTEIENAQQEALDGLESALEENKNNINAKFDEVLAKGLDTYTKLREEGRSALSALSEVAAQINSMSSSGGASGSSGFGFNYAKGGSSSEVAAAQQSLVDAGYSVGSTGVDSIWGKNTEKA